MLNRTGGAELDRAFKALADPTRRAVIERLAMGPASVRDLAEPLPMSLPAVMQHVHVLEDCGLVRTEKVGRVRTCRIEPRTLRGVEQWVADQRTAWEQRLDRLGMALELDELGHPDTRGPAERAEPEPERTEP